MRNPNSRPRVSNPYLAATRMLEIDPRQEIADALAFALCFDGRKRKHEAAEIMSAIVAKRLVEHVERSGFVVMKRPPIGGSPPPYRSEVAPRRDAGAAPQS